MSRRARKVFRATVVEGFGGLIFLMLLGAALPRLVDTGNVTEKDAGQKVQSVDPAVFMRDLNVSASGSPPAGQQSAAVDSATANYPQALLDRVGWTQKIGVQPHVYLTDRRSAFE